MASLTITVPDAVVTRIQAAFGHIDPITLLFVPATVTEIQAAIKNFVKARVIDAEVATTATTKRTDVSSEGW